MNFSHNTGGDFSHNMGGNFYQNTGGVHNTIPSGTWGGGGLQKEESDMSGDDSDEVGCGPKP